ncbi:uncharacterized protein UBRO2_05969 [Ustilago bromivora]|uniref:Uncharacterized protein n=1 Tax=Ustilago bromivora TaxID=307758 RepID=A0A8H8TV87_9BASI|nr:uncharacterized protein UBRO2_05969 [Ustilago bromivora]
MPPQPNDPHTANDPSLEESSDDQAEMIPVPVEHQGITKYDTSSSDNSDSDNSNPSKPLLDLNNINTLCNMLTQSTLSWGLNELYNQLKKDLTKMEHIAESTLLYEAGKICMFNADVHKLSDVINKHWAKAETMGYNLMWVLKIKPLIDQAKFITVYHNCIMNLQYNS